MLVIFFDKNKVGVECGPRVSFGNGDLDGLAETKGCPYLFGWAVLTKRYISRPTIDYGL